MRQAASVCDSDGPYYISGTVMTFLAKSYRRFHNRRFPLALGRPLKQYALYSRYNRPACIRGYALDEPYAIHAFGLSVYILYP